VNHGKPRTYATWARVQSVLGFTKDWIDSIDDFEVMIEHYTFPPKLVSKYRECFKEHAKKSSEKPYVSNIREFL